MFGFLKLFRRRTVDPPTQKQLSYAKRLGIAVTPKMSKADVSKLIGEAEHKNPKLTEKRETANHQKQLKTYGQDLVDAERAWNDLFESTRYILAVYRKGKNTVVDVLDCNGAEINGRGKLVLEMLEPKRVRDKNIGEYLEWEKRVVIAADDLRYYEPLHKGFGDDGVEAYQKAVSRGLKLAKKLPRR